MDLTLDVRNALAPQALHQRVHEGLEPEAAWLGVLAHAIRVLTHKIHGKLLLLRVREVRKLYCRGYRC